ncbi:hypothetical protein ALC57_14168 [Trachymyrmex cornetzi]|uniref:Vitellogenin domain-containing protein n=1 Tax=Trachymyrmex cornetzi TaxID=471704 RepID=A0A151IYK2_9HYME|nr:hypothetical protein ALC57_14168 [Trachymyrmex cornetzi]
MNLRFLIMLSLVRCASFLVGYDCERTHPNSTLISLLDTEDCSPPERNIAQQNVYIELLQRPRNTSVDVLGCRIEFENIYERPTNPLYREGCNHVPHVTIYRGPATKIWTQSTPDSYVLTDNTKHIIFLVHARHEACNNTILQTEHPRFVIREITNNSFKDVNRLRFITSYPSPYYFIKNIAHRSVSNLYASIMLKKCQEESMKIRTTISNAYGDPNALAYALTERAGYSAHIQGEAARILRCLPIPVQIRTTGTCFLELPVVANGAPMYLTHRTRTLSTKGTEVRCRPEETATYKLRG